MAEPDMQFHVYRKIPFGTPLNTCYVRAKKAEIVLLSWKVGPD